MKNFISLLVLALLTTVSKNVNAQAGTLDTTFNNVGIVTTDLGSNKDEIDAIGVQSDGKIVVAGSSKLSASDYQFALARYFSDGILDTTFGNNGMVLTNFGNSFDGALGLVIQSNGKILVAGYSFEGGYDFALARYNVDGSLDISFDTTGKVTTNLGGTYDVAYAVTLQNNGKIIVAGEDNSRFGLVRYNTNGTRDTTFGTNGIVSTGFSSLNDGAYGIAIQTDGNIVVGGLAYSSITGVDFALARYDTTGTLDTTFDNDGKVTIDINNNSFDEGHALFIQPDGKILLAGSFTTNADKGYAVIRVNSDGTLDSSFSSNGIAMFNISTLDDYCSAIALQTDGRILLAGITGNSTSSHITMLRLNSNGTIDGSFGIGGILTTINNIYSDAYCMTLQNDEKILVGGDTEYPGGNSDFAVFRYNNDVQLGLIDFSNINLPILVYPNPIKHLINLQYTIEENGHITINLFDVNGKKVQTFFKNQLRLKGHCEEHLLLDKTYSSGTYVLSITDGLGTQGGTVKIIFE